MLLPFLAETREDRKRLTLQDGFIYLVIIDLSGGERGIRTLDRVSPIHAFQACAFNRSAISPERERPNPLALLSVA